MEAYDLLYMMEREESLPSRGKTEQDKYRRGVLYSMITNNTVSSPKGKARQGRVTKIRKAGPRPRGGEHEHAEGIST